MIAALDGDNHSTVRPQECDGAVVLGFGFQNGNELAKELLSLRIHACAPGQKQRGLGQPLEDSILDPKVSPHHLSPASALTIEAFHILKEIASRDRDGSRGNRW